jgi:plastocyanin
MMSRHLALVGALWLAGALFTAAASAADAPAEIALTIENNRFQPEDIRVKAGAAFLLVITNKDRGPEEFESHDLRIEKVIPAGKTVRLKMPALKPGTYGFIGEYHEKTAKGRIVAE